MVKREEAIEIKSIVRLFFMLKWNLKGVYEVRPKQNLQVFFKRAKWKEKTKQTEVNNWEIIPPE